MINMNLSALVAALDETARESLEGAAEICVSRGGYEIGLEDYFEHLAETNIFLDICRQFEINIDVLNQQLKKGRKPSGKAGGRPVFSPILIEFLQEAYLLGTLEMGEQTVDVLILVLTLLLNPARYSVLPFFRELGRISPEKLRTLIEGLKSSGAGQGGDAANGGNKGGSTAALAKYATDFTEEARQGKIDPVFTRGDEIRQVIDILTRRRKNNPILVGDPGVGKTAVAEGLALKIVQGDVPDALLNVRFVGLDMGRLQAGASVKGEFEKRLKMVIDEVKSSPVPTILFIDEAHTLVGAGNAAGSGDGANLLKPALARGELRTLAATTWSEYKKYFEKDAALARRFQLVKLDEPSTEQTISILRGLAPNYEKSHQVYIQDDAVVLVAELSARYISGRYLPDKAIDVLDTACARVKVSLGAKPAELETIEEQLRALKVEQEARQRDLDYGITPCPHKNIDMDELRLKIIKLSDSAEDIKSRWLKEKDLVNNIIQLRTSNISPIEEAAQAADDEQSTDDAPIEDYPSSHAAADNISSELMPGPKEKADRLKNLITQLKHFQADKPLVYFEVDPPLVTNIISEWTGVPAEKLKGQAHTMNKLTKRLGLRVLGQDAAIEVVEKSMLTVFSGLENPNMPNGIFLLVGPSGVGKTETALAVAEEIFGGEQFLISVNMSEFQEKHTISRLIGSPPGYVGYGEGGRLTEAVRRQPYSAVLFDEVEKSHPDILNLFYQMFDKGVLADGEGRNIDFRNTTIFMTSNLGGDIISALCEEEIPDYEIIQAALRPALASFFKPALLGRLTIVPYLPMRPDVLAELTNIKMQRLKERFNGRHNLHLTWDKEVIENIVIGCKAVDSGARNIDHIMNASLLPKLAAFILGNINNNYSGVNIGLDTEKNMFVFNGFNHALS